jgi:hypothetical protein
MPVRPLASQAVQNRTKSAHQHEAAGMHEVVGRDAYECLRSCNRCPPGACLAGAFAACEEWHA